MTEGWEHTMVKRICPTACQAEGFVYPECLCTEAGRAIIAASDHEAWMRIYGE